MGKQHAWQVMNGTVIITPLKQRSRAADLDGVAQAGAGAVQLQCSDVTRLGSGVAERRANDCLHSARLPVSLYSLHERVLWRALPTECSS